MAEPAFSAPDLREMITSLDGYIQRRAEEMAAPLVAEAVARAQERAVKAQGEVVRWKFEALRWHDLNTDLGRRISAMERQVTRWRDLAEGKVRELIVPWGEVSKGDQVLEGGDMSLVDGTDVYDDHLGIDVIREDGRHSYLDRQPGSLTAVRRYDTLASTPDDLSGASTSSRGD
jgi:hypothetical protein